MPSTQAKPLGRAGHTAGPWGRLSTGDYWPHCDALNGLPVTWINIGPAASEMPVAIILSHEQDEATPQLVANANLIAAAPDMLAALKKFIAAYDAAIVRSDPIGFAHEAAVAAIAKAEGRP